MSVFPRFGRAVCPRFPKMMRTICVGNPYSWWMLVVKTSVSQVDFPINHRLRRAFFAPDHGTGSPNSRQQQNQEFPDIELSIHICAYHCHYHYPVLTWLIISSIHDPSSFSALRQGSNGKTSPRSGPRLQPWGEDNEARAVRRSMKLQGTPPGTTPYTW